MKETFGQRFNRLRKKYDLTQEEVANKLSVSSQAVSKWENDISMPDISLLIEIAELFNITVDELLGKEIKSPILLEEPSKKDIKSLTLKIKVLSSDGDKININLPFALIKAYMGSGKAIPTIDGNQALNNIDFNQIVELVEQGVVGQIAEIESSDGDRILIIIE